MKLLKSYFNFQINRKVLKTKSMPTRFKRLSTKRIFVGKGELKHTSSKVIITFYVHNTEKMYLSRAVNLVFKSLYNPKRRLKNLSLKIEIIKRLYLTIDLLL